MTTTCFKVLFCCGLLFPAVQSRASGADTLFLQGHETRVDLLPHLVAFHSPVDLPPDDVVEKILTHGQSLSNATIGFTKDIYWVIFTIKNLSSDHLQYVLEVDNPQIDYLQAYQLSDQKVTPWILTGDQFTFDKRPRNNRNFVFPVTLRGGEHKSYLFKIVKHNSSLNFPIFLWSEAGHHYKDYVQNLGYGLYLGFILLCAVYSLLTFVFLRSTIYLWYFTWIVSCALFVFTGLGFSIQFLYPGVSDLNSIFRVFVEVLNFIAFLKFSQKFLRAELFAPVLSKVFNYIAIAMVVLLIPLPFKPDVYFEYSHLLLPFVNVIMLLSLSMIIYISVISYQKQRATVIFYYVAFIALLVGGLMMLGIEFGIIPAEGFSVNPFMIGSAIELLIFSIALTYQVKKVYDERNQLTMRFAQQQKELLKAYVEGVERERERISRELHDDIGSRLSTLNRFFSGHLGEKESVHKIQEQIDILCDDVRNMSHQLAPTSLKITGLKTKIFELAAQLKLGKNIQVDIQFYDFPENLSDDITIHLYRILQEAVQNIMKHAQATVVDLQFFAHEDELVVTIEDNGKGFDNGTGAGIGLQNMQARTSSLHGVLEVSSQPGKGTQLLLRIPYTKEETASHDVMTRQ